MRVSTNKLSENVGLMRGACTVKAKTLKTKEKLFAAFWDIYCQKRIEKITVKEITEQAGYNRSTFYEYFEDVYDVLACLEERLIPNLDELPPITFLDKSIGMEKERFFDLFEKNAKYYRVLLSDQGDPSFATKLKQTMKPLVLPLLDIQQGEEQIKYEYIIEYILSGMIGVLAFWVQQDEPLPKEIVFQFIEKMMDSKIFSVKLSSQ